MRLDGYIRVSKVGNRKGANYISPRVQREDIVRWISAHGGSLGEIFTEENQSGGRRDRPELMRAIERVEFGESDGIVVARLSRFGRSILDGLQMIARVQKAGGTLVSVHEGFDLKTPTGKMVAAVLFAVGEWERDQIREYWNEARRKGTERGAYIGKSPIGYLKLKSGKLSVDPHAGPIIAELFQRRLAGERSKDNVAFLNASRARTMSGKPFTAASVHSIVKNPVYKGTVRSGSYEKPKAHEPLVEPDQWQRCQVKERSPGHKNGNLLRARIRCASCGRIMIADSSQVKQGFNNCYFCPGSRRDCSSPARVSCLEIDPLIEEFIFEHGNSAPLAGSERQKAEAEAAVEKAEQDLDRYRDNVALERTLGPDRFEAGAAARVYRLERRLLELARAKGIQEKVPHIDTQRVESEWPDLDWDERRKWISRAVDFVVVERGLAPVIERSWVYRRNRAPVIQMDGSFEFRPSLPYTGRLYRHRPWGVRRIESELRSFFESRKRVWPIYYDFAKAGKGRLHAQVYEWGGPYFWGNLLDIRVPAQLVRWDYPRLRGALRPVLKGQESWPKPARFHALGLDKLYAAIEVRGGYQFWADEFELPYEARACRFALRRWPAWRIDRELRGFVRRRRTFPTAPEFELAEKQELLKAVRRRGGVEYWASQLRVRPPRTAL